MNTDVKVELRRDLNLNIYYPLVHFMELMSIRQSCSNYFGNNLTKKENSPKYAGNLR